MNGILALVDFSEGTAEVLEQAARLAAALKREAVVLHVAAPDPDFVGYEAGPQTVRNTVAERLRKEHHELQGMEARLKEQGVAATALLVQGPTLEKILDEIARLQPSLIVMGSRGRGLLHALLAGSVTEGVLRRAERPVLVVPMKRA